MRGLKAGCRNVEQTSQDMFCLFVFSLRVLIVAKPVVNQPPVLIFRSLVRPCGGGGGGGQKQGAPPGGGLLLKGGELIFVLPPFFFFFGGAPPSQY